MFPYFSSVGSFRTLFPSFLRRDLLWNVYFLHYIIVTLGPASDGCVCVCVLRLTMDMLDRLIV
jgi:hypothetical protein